MLITFSLQIIEFSLINKKNNGVLMLICICILKWTCYCVVFFFI